MEMSQIENIMGIKQDTQGLKFLIKWKNKRICESTWEKAASFSDRKQLSQMFRSFQTNCIIASKKKRKRKLQALQRERMEMDLKKINKQKTKLEPAQFLKSEEEEEDCLIVNENPPSIKKDKGNGSRGVIGAGDTKRREKSKWAQKREFWIRKVLAKTASDNVSVDTRGRFLN